jgi:hypothetical protein
MLPGYDGLSATTAAPEYLFYLVGNLYLTYAAVVAAVLAFDAAEEPDVTHPGAFRACGVGLAAVVISGPGMRVLSVGASSAVGTSIPVRVDTIGKIISGLGLLLAAIAICTIGLHTLVLKHRHRTRLRSNYGELYCVMSCLYKYVGPIGLYQRVGRLRLIFEPGPAYVARVGYCRDALWLTSKYVDQTEAALYVGQNGRIPIDAQAFLVWEAAERMVNGEAALGPPFIIAASDDAGEGDSQQLVLLSRALQRIIPGERFAEVSA